MKREPLGIIPTFLLILGAILVLASIKLPYWSIWIAAPQYPKGLVVTTYVTGVAGDVREVDGLNHYIGMRPLGEAAPFERKIAVPGISAIAASLFLLAFLRKKWAIIFLLPAIALPFVFAGDLYWWMREFGLNLDPKAPLSSSVKPFVPPIFGAGKIAQFHVVATFKIGWWSTVLGALLGIIAVKLRFFSKKSPGQPAKINPKATKDSTDDEQVSESATCAAAAPIIQLKSFLIWVVAVMLLCSVSTACAKEWVVSAQGDFNRLQEAVETAQSGDTIRVVGGVHKGNFRLSKTLHLVGEQGAVLDGENRGTVVQFDMPNSSIRGFIIRNSGDVFTSEDSGIRVQAAQATVENNLIENTLFGVSLSRAKNSVVKNNRIFSKDLAVARRGDQIRIWYSDGVKVESNEIVGGRDLVLWYSKDLIIRKNKVRQGRYGLHFMYCNNGLVEENVLSENSVGVYLMYSRGLKLIRNHISNNRGPSGFGIGLKDMEQVTVSQNLVASNRVGIFIDNAHGEYLGNLLVFNDLGIHLFLSSQPNQFSSNQFIENAEQTLIGAKGDLKSARWDGNYWSDYSGFDLDGDGVGDTPYKPVRLFERITDQHAGLRVFANSPSSQALDFAARLFPMFAPQPKFTDSKPLMQVSHQTLNALPFQSQSLEGGRKHWLMVAAVLFLTGMIIVKPMGASRWSRGMKNLTSRTRSQNLSVVAGTEIIAQARGLTKRFGSQLVLDHISMDVRQGETIALWGSNGAGKTTILRCLLGLIDYEGTVSLLGHNPLKHGKAARQVVGYVPQLIHLHGDLTVKETLEFYSQIREVPLERAQLLLEEWQLKPHAEKQVNNLSGGMKQKLALVIALLSDPPILLLDEPTAHLDVQARQEWRNLLERLKAEGKTLIFCTHHISEVRQLADRVVVIEKGRKVIECSPEELARFWKQTMMLYITVDSDSRETAMRVLQAAGYAALSEGSTIQVQAEPHRKLEPLRLLMDEGVNVLDSDWFPTGSGDLALEEMPPHEESLAPLQTPPARSALKLARLDFRSMNIIAGKEIRDSLSNRWFLFFTAIFTLLSLAVSLMGLAGTGSLGVAGFGRTAASLVNLVLLIVPLMGLMLGATSIAVEKDQKTLQTLLAQPLNRSEILMGKFAGLALSLTGAILFGFGFSGLAMALSGVTAQIGVYLWLVGFTLMLGLACLAIGFSMSVLVQRSATATSAALFVWLTMLFISDLGIMGTALSLKLSAQQLLNLVMINPAQVFKLAVIQVIQGNLEILGGAGLYATERFGGRLILVLSGLLLLWTAVPLIFSLVWFTGRRSNQ